MKGLIKMKMNEKEYEELILHFEFLAEKAEQCYQNEVKQVVKNLKEEYKNFIEKW